MRVVLVSAIAPVLVAGCSMTPLNETNARLATEPAVSGFDAYKTEAGIAAMAASFRGRETREVARHTCRDGSRGVWVGPMHLCPASFKKPVLSTNDDSALRVAVASVQGASPMAAAAGAGDQDDADQAGAGQDDNDQDDGAPTTVAEVSDAAATDGGETAADAAPEAAAPAAEDNTAFTEKYDRLEQVYGTRDFNELAGDDQNDVREFYNENGGDADWSAYGS